MIDKEGAHCSRCPEFEESDGRSFQEMVDAIKLMGWKIFKVGNVWLHYCPCCVEKTSGKRPVQVNHERPKNPQWWHD